MGEGRELRRLLAVGGAGGAEFLRPVLEEERPDLEM